ncbi:MAG: two-component sensor histidine kinase, partial [Pseudomonadota bacterium]
MSEPVSRRGNRLGFVRTTAFKLSAIYIAIFTVFATFLIAYIGFNSGRILTQQVSFAVAEELDLLAAHYRQGGIRRLMNTINRRAGRPGASLYLLTSRDGA